MRQIQLKVSLYWKSDVYFLQDFWGAINFQLVVYAKEQVEGGPDCNWNMSNFNHDCFSY